MAKISKHPKVNQTQEFIEIANDFSNPLDVIRESISNSYDAGANSIDITFKMEKVSGDDELVLVIKDDGCGMNECELESFFDLGNSTKRNNKDLIGEKGHGTKVYFNSSNIEVVTKKNGSQLKAIMKNPLNNLHDGRLPEIEIEEDSCDNTEHGTTITIRGYNKNRCEKFKPKLLKDYILWFTKHGSVQKAILMYDKDSVGNSVNEKEWPVLRLNVFGSEETINHGHVFPDKKNSIKTLMAAHPGDAGDYYTNIIVKHGTLKNNPHIQYDAIFSIEGNKAKWGYNDMLKHRGYSAPDGGYTVQERYGVWICKDYIPIERKNEWIISKGSEYTRLHAFFNCQELRLTANRSSVENTPSSILDDIQLEIRKIYDEIQLSQAWLDLNDLEGSSKAYNTQEKEKKMYSRRIKLIKSTKIADYNGIRLVEPTQENGVFAMFMQLQSIEPNLFPFVILDYNTHEGIDVLVKERDNDEPAVKGKNIYYVEFKNLLTTEYNHSFKYTHSIVCWDIDPALTRNEEVIDISDEKRRLQQIPPLNSSDRTQYFLDAERCPKKIEVFCLKTYLREVAGIQFRTRTEEDIF